MALHFFLLSTFSWLLVQGEALYQATVNVFNDRQSSFKNVAILGWVIPALVVMICGFVAWDDYDYQDTCWIDMSSKLAIAVVLPLVLLISINLTICLAVMFTLRRSKSGVNASIILVIVVMLGLAWFFGVMSYLHEDVLWQYLFAVAMLAQTVAWTYSHLFRHKRVLQTFKATISGEVGLLLSTQP